MSQKINIVSMCKNCLTDEELRNGCHLLLGLFNPLLPLPTRNLSLPLSLSLSLPHAHTHAHTHSVNNISSNIYKKIIQMLATFLTQLFFVHRIMRDSKIPVSFSFIEV